jgi:hypothetical protein
MWWTTDAIGGMGWGSETVIRGLIQSITPADCVRAKKLTMTGQERAPRVT